MTTQRNLDDGPGIKKLQELAEEINVCMFCTSTGEIPFNVRPMYTQLVDDMGHFWFFSLVNSNKHEEIKQDDHVQLLYAKPSAGHFLSVYGKADIVKDEHITNVLWKEANTSWFPNGKNDPALRLIRVKPIEGHYWDTRDGKMLAMLTVVAAAAGHKQNNVVEGDIVM